MHLWLKAKGIIFSIAYSLSPPGNFSQFKKKKKENTKHKVLFFSFLPTWSWNCQGAILYNTVQFQQQLFVRAHLVLQSHSWKEENTFFLSVYLSRDTRVVPLWVCETLPSFSSQQVCTQLNLTYLLFVHSIKSINKTKVSLTENRMAHWCWVRLSLFLGGVRLEKLKIGDR